MAQLVLGQAGARLGAQLLPQGLGFIGRAAGSVLGAAIDARLSPAAEGARVRDFHLTEGREGASIPVVYGRMRVGGQLIWAARFKETRRTTSGGKGGPRVNEYSYTLSFAVALCEGVVTQVTRCWANGEALDLSRVNWRLYPGTEAQAPDPLIEAIEGAAPAYRGTAYIVFEDLPVDAYGGRMPQMSFEVTRPAAAGAGRLEAVTRAVNMIPGSGEFALATEIVRRVAGPGVESVENAHAAAGISDFQASLDQLGAELPNVTRVNLIVAWFGDDLRCSVCRIRPGVESGEKTTSPMTWSVAGRAREDAYVVSRTDDRPNYGGTPSDAAVRQAIIALKARGYHVTLYPFVLMDVPDGNGLPDPYGGEAQARHPWRGRVTCHPAPGQPDTPDGSADAAAQVDAFFGGVDGYRAFILHNAALAAETFADGILIGSEMIGLTRVRDAAGGYPAVDALRTLAGEVRAVVGDGVEISYAADWTEYGAHVRNGGADVSFPLDALWADADIDHVGLDWYAPIGDWRSGESHADAHWDSERDYGYLAANIGGGEAFDWYYADDAGRAVQERLPITDGAYDEPWVFRQKDVRGWWMHAHHERTAGVRSGASTGWSPGMKPVRFVEFGCPAVDRGANQPNVFYDPKSSESALPHFSGGQRDDLIQRRAIEAFCAYWSDADNNPASGAYAGRMTPDDGVAVWAWDARPWPAFPTLEDVWADHANWRLGHWLNGRTGLALLPDVVSDICARAGVDADVGQLDGVVAGYRFDGPGSARAALEPLAAAFGVDACERDGVLAFRMRGGEADYEIDAGDLVETEARAPLQASSMDVEAGPIGVRFRHIDLDADHAPGVVLSDFAAEGRIVDVEAGVAMSRTEAKRRANEIAEDLAQQREQAAFALSAAGSHVEPGDVLSLSGRAYRVLEISDGPVIAVTACAAGPSRARSASTPDPAPAPPVAVDVTPDFVVAEPPPLPGEEDDGRPLAFAWSEPWSGPVRVSASPEGGSMRARGTIASPCAMGRTESALYPHVSGRWQDASVWVRVRGHAPQSRSDAAVLNGANMALVETASGWELIQFAGAEMTGADTYRLSRLLRGQQGSEPEMAEGSAAGARILFLTGDEVRLEAGDWAHDLEFDWTAWRRSPDEATAASATLANGKRHARMWSPAHLRAEAAGGDVALSWVRRARKGGDGWGAGEPPHETAEAYRVTVLAGDAVVRQWETGATSAVYAAALIAEDFPGGGDALIEVAQLGADGQPGAVASRTLELG